MYVWYMSISKPFSTPYRRRAADRKQVLSLATADGVQRMLSAVGRSLLKELLQIIDKSPDLARHMPPRRVHRRQV